MLLFGDARWHVQLFIATGDGSKHGYGREHGKRWGKRPVVGSIIYRPTHARKSRLLICPGITNSVHIFLSLGYKRGQR